MPTLSQMRDQVDQFLTDRWAMIRNRQNAFQASHGRYWQGLITHDACPTHTDAADGSSVGTRLNRGPTDQIATWLDVLPEWAGESLPACIQVDVYDGPRGQGWVLSVQAAHGGNLYRRSQNVGPETYRTTAWQRLEVET
jgi:hypothetical protein